MLMKKFSALNLPAWHGRGFQTFSLFVLLFSFQTLAQAQCSGNTVLSLSGASTDTWTAPSTGGPFQVQISVTGSGGGDSENNNQGGSGANMIGTFVVQNGEILRGISGGAGESSTFAGGGGGAGSGVVNCGTSGNCLGGTLLILAAGGNGGESQGDGLGGSSATGGSGNGGSGGGSNGGGGGGGGINFGGGSGTGGGGSSPGAGGGQVILSGVSSGGDGAFTISDPDGGSGMGGGGGAGSGNNNGSGGGAGHTGAPGGNGSAATSLNSGTNQQNSSGSTGAGPSDGSVTILCLGSLPVELINFKAVVQTGLVRLLWSTATEKNNAGYEIERSGDHRNWSGIGFVAGNGNSVQRRDYEFTDAQPLAGPNYYRLKQMDTDGAYEYSPIVIADVRAGVSGFDVFPNPSSDGLLSFRIVNEKEGEGSLEIFDWVGYKVYRETIDLLPGTNVFPVSMASFPKGVYTARFETPDGQLQFRKIMLR